MPENVLSPEQRRIRDLENLLALERGRKDPEVELAALEHPGAAENILIHFLEDGFTALGKVWYRGQELEFAPGSAAYAETCDRTGRSWLDLRHDEGRQLDRWDKVMFRTGPWPGKTYVDGATAAFEVLKPLREDGTPPARPTADELAVAQATEAERHRAAPLLPTR